MTQKWIGSVLIIAGCGGIGFSMASFHRKNEKLLRQLIRILHYMQWELQYRVTPLPELCQAAAMESTNPFRDIFLCLSQELEKQDCSDATSCMEIVMAKGQELPETIRYLLRELGYTLGHFDLSGQLDGLEAVRLLCQKKLEELEFNRDVRLRGYETLGICAGAALAIILN